MPRTIRLAQLVTSRQIGSKPWNDHCLRRVDLMTATKNSSSIRHASDLPRYIPAIDGLRGIAVLAVITFHLNRKWLPGGFIGVDVFFVISGYLITSILTREYNQKTFSVAKFYQRRIARLGPALFAVILATLAAASLLYSAVDLALAGGEATAAALSLANVRGMFRGNYFSNSPDAEPLLHCWSLSVEEQFYLLYPVLVLSCIEGYLATERRSCARSFVEVFFSVFYWRSASLFGRSICCRRGRGNCLQEAFSRIFANATRLSMSGPNAFQPCRGSACLSSSSRHAAFTREGGFRVTSPWLPSWGRCVYWHRWSKPIRGRTESFLGRHSSSSGGCRIRYISGIGRYLRS